MGPLLAVMVLLILAACEVTPTSPELLNRAQLLLLGKRRDLSALRRIVLALARNGGKADFAGWNRLFFERANFNHPFAAAAIYYNDKAGIRAMAGAIAWERRVPVLPDPAPALVTIELRDKADECCPA